MGSGKSHWGKAWAEVYNKALIDLDAEIEKKESMFVADIFEKKGEDYFREKEAEVLRGLSIDEHTLVSCGGGSPCFFNNMDWMNEHGLTVYLDATPAYLLNNIKNEKDKRPLLKNTNDAELLFFIEQKLKERNPFYTQSALTLQAQELSIESFKNIVSHSL